MTMDRSPRANRVLAGLFDELADARTPDYLEAAIERASSRPQRPAWTFPERWLPMADIASRSAFAPRLPLRTIGVALVILALLIGLAVAVVGSRQAKLPPAFGLARNGLVAYSANGDIYTADPVTGVITPFATGQEVDFYPSFSPDGTRIAFLRQVSAVQRDIVVVRADGTDLKVITTEPIWYQDSAEWAPDSSAVMVGTTTKKLLRFDATKAGPAQVIAENIVTDATLAPRPPDGAQILYDQPAEIPGAGIWVMNADGSGAHAIFQKSGPATDQAIGAYRWSPDGTMVAFTQQSDGASRIYVMNADGTGLRPLADEPGVWNENDLVWSPDGMHIAFNRWQYDAAKDTWNIRPIGIASLAGGPVLDAGPVPASDGAVFDYSPDGSTFLSLPAPVVGGDPFLATVRATAIDTATGKSHQVDWPVGSGTSWQRLPID